MDTRARISVEGGIVNIDPKFYEWGYLGGTCNVTLRRGCYVTSPFRIFPTPADKIGRAEGDLVLCDVHFGKATRYFVLFHVKRQDNGFVTVVENPTKAGDLVGASRNFQLLDDGTVELRVNKTCFSSNENALAAEGESMMVTDVSDILKYIAGHITAKELRAASKRAQRQLTLKRRLRDVESQLRQERRHSWELEGAVNHLRSERDDLRRRLGELAQQAA